MSTLQDADALPQLIGDYKPLDQWQAHLNTLFYRLRGDKLRTYYQTFASADFRLAHALAADYFEKAAKRDKLKPSTAPLIVMELGPGNGNLAACFLSHLKAIDKAGQVYPRVKYVLVDWEQSILDGALAHPDLVPHKDRVQAVVGTVDHGLDADALLREKEYRKVEWKDVPYRKTITEFLKTIDEQVLVPVNLGAFATLKEAKRLLAPDAIGFSAFDAGTSDMQVLNDPDKPCYGQFGGQYSFMINFALVEAVAKHLGLAKVEIEPQREFVGRSLNTNVITLMDLLATHPSAGPKMQPWEQDRLVLKTIKALNEAYESPYSRALDFPLQKNMPMEERETLNGMLLSLKRTGVPDTVAYLTEEELSSVSRDLEAVGYDPDTLNVAFTAPPSPIEYHHFLCK